MREHQQRSTVVGFVREQVVSCREAARRLTVPARTLAYWCQRQLQGQLAVRPRGRPCRAPTPQEHAEVTLLLEETGPRLGLPTLQACCPQTPRCVLEYLLANYRQQFRSSHLRMAEQLRWNRPGTVWAIDHSEPPRPIDGHFRQILAVRDLASGMQLAWTPVADATAVEAVAVLQGLVLEHGAPLVLKSDNGSAFKSDDFGAWLTEHQVVPLLSPVRMPRYNGACEAGIGAAKRRTEYLAARQGRYLDWTTDDLHAAQRWANEASYPGGFAAGTPASRFAARLPINDIERDTFHAAVLQYERQVNHETCTRGDALTDMLLAIHHRRAVRHVLVEQGYLDITRRSVPQPLPAKKCAKIK